MKHTLKLQVHQFPQMHFLQVYLYCELYGQTFLYGTDLAIIQAINHTID